MAIAASFGFGSAAAACSSDSTTVPAPSAASAASAAPTVSAAPENSATASSAAAATVPSIAEPTAPHLLAVAPVFDILTSAPDTGSTSPYDPSAAATLPTQDGSMFLSVAPAALVDQAFAPRSAEAAVANGAWVVMATLNPDRTDMWSAAFALCFARAEGCPTGQLAIILDGVVLTAPTVQAPTFEGQLQISGDFTEESAKALAAAINSLG